MKKNINKLSIVQLGSGEFCFKVGKNQIIKKQDIRLVGLSNGNWAYMDKNNNVIQEVGVVFEKNNDNDDIIEK